MISSVGESIGELAKEMGFPSGIVLGGEIVVLLVSEPVLFSSPFESVGEATTSLLIVDAEVRDATRGVGTSLGFAVIAVTSGWESVRIAIASADGFAYDTHVSVRVRAQLVRGGQIFGTFRNCKKEGRLTCEGIGFILRWVIDSNWSSIRNLVVGSSRVLSSSGRRHPSPLPPSSSIAEDLLG